MQISRRELNFLGIGSQRCASTWLYYALKKSPKINLPRKELNFWSGFVTREGVNEYFEQFRQNDCEQAIICGEISPTYSAMYPDEVALLKSLLPDLKIIFIIRNPVDRLISSITRRGTYYKVDKGVSTNKNIFHLLRSIDTGLSIRLTDYARAYKIWSDYYGKDNIFIEKFDRIQSDSQSVLKEIFEFLGIEPVIEEIPPQNKSKEEIKAEIPELLRWYTALTWLPKVKKMNKEIPLDLSDWIDDLQIIFAQNKYNAKYWVIFGLHQIYFRIPYHAIYPLFKFFQIKLKIAKSYRQL